MGAAAEGCVDMVKVLLDAHADPDRHTPSEKLKDKDGNQSISSGKYTPLHFATREGHVRVIRVLLDAKASPHATNERGLSALDLARFSSHRDAVLRELNAKSKRV